MRRHESICQGVACLSHLLPLPGVPDLPSGVMEQLQRLLLKGLMPLLYRLPYAELHHNVALLFAVARSRSSLSGTKDIKGFTPLCARSRDPEVMVVVDRLFNCFDSIIEARQACSKG